MLRPRLFQIGDRVCGNWSPAGRTQPGIVRDISYYKGTRWCRVYWTQYGTVGTCAEESLRSYNDPGEI